MLGRFFLVAPSKAMKESEALSADPMSTRKVSPPLPTTTPMTFSPLAGMYLEKEYGMR